VDYKENGAGSVLLSVIGRDAAVCVVSHAYEVFYPSLHGKDEVSGPYSMGWPTDAYLK